jgi:regulator of sigma E protease
MDILISFSSNLFWFLIIISVVVFIHEYGHYFVARKCGVKIETFSIGFGKEIFGWNDKNGTRWKISVLPFGGYVKMFGDADPSSAPDFEKISKMKSKDKQQSFYFKKLWQKAAIVFAGPFANYLLAIVIFTSMFYAYGKPHTLPVISHIEVGSPAEKSGLKIDDLIIAADNTKIESFEDLKQIIALNTGEPLILSIERKGQHLDLTIIPQIKKIKDVFGNEIEIAMIGIASSKVELLKLDLMSSIGESFVASYNMSIGMLKAIWQIVTGVRGTDQLGGPIKIAQYSGQSAKLGLESVLSFIALISLNLGLVNLFPIPMLDGGHLMYYSIEAATGRPVAQKIQEIGFKLGFALLITLMIFVTFNDIKALFK